MEQKYLCPHCDGDVIFENESNGIQIIRCTNNHYLGIIDNRPASILTKQLDGIIKILNNFQNTYQGSQNNQALNDLKNDPQYQKVMRLMRDNNQETI